MNIAWGGAGPVLPLGELGGRLGRKAKGGAKICKEEVVTHKNWINL